MNTEKDPSGNPQDWKFSTVRVLVVDEGSLVSVQILHSILSLLTKHADLQKFIILGRHIACIIISHLGCICNVFISDIFCSFKYYFVSAGDVRQLPSIEPGNTLYDLFEGLKKVQWAIEMKTNHRAESELIVRNAGL